MPRSLERMHEWTKKMEEQEDVRLLCINAFGERDLIMTLYATDVSVVVSVVVSVCALSSCAQLTISTTTHDVPLNDVPLNDVQLNDVPLNMTCQCMTCTSPCRCRSKWSSPATPPWRHRSQPSRTA